MLYLRVYLSDFYNYLIRLDSAKQVIILKNLLEL